MARKGSDRLGPLLPQTIPLCSFNPLPCTCVRAKRSNSTKPFAPLKPLPDMQRLLSLLAVWLCLASCAPEAPAGTIDTAPFFDLSGYISQEVERLEAAKTKVEKTITLNGVVETKQLDDINFSNDLRLFREADINRPAWLEKYTTETQTLSGSHTITTYTAQDSNLIVRQLMVEEDLGVTIKIEIDRKTGTVLSDGQHHLIYEPAKGYRVKTQQTNRFGDDVDALIEVEWLR